jgi:hypothetical protein
MNKRFIIISLLVLSFICVSTGNVMAQNISIGISDSNGQDITLEHHAFIGENIHLNITMTNDDGTNMTNLHYLLILIADGYGSGGYYNPKQNETQIASSLLNQSKNMENSYKISPKKSVDISKIAIGESILLQYNITIKTAGRWNLYLFERTMQGIITIKSLIIIVERNIPNYLPSSTFILPLIPSSILASIIYYVKRKNKHGSVG